MYEYGNTQVHIKPPRKGLFQKLGAWNRNRKERRRSQKSNTETLLVLETSIDVNGTGLPTQTGVNASADAAISERVDGKIMIGLGQVMTPVLESLKATGPVMATAQIPLALVIAMILIRAFWYYREYRSKILQKNKILCTLDKHKLNR